MCMGVDKYVNKYDNLCIKCNSEDQTVLDFSNVDMTQYNNGDIIEGYLNSLSWVIIKSSLIDSSTEDTINKIAYNDNHWYKIGEQ